MPGTQTTILDRRSAAAKSGETRDVLVLAAIDGPRTLESALRIEAVPQKPKPQPEPTREPAGACFRSISVEGFRGIGPKAKLDLTPGPGLTLVVGRNGSGKSSFAEALELLLTGDTFRWRQRTKAWCEGWRNLHHKPATIEADILIQGEQGPGVVFRRWPDERTWPPGSPPSRCTASRSPTSRLWAGKVLSGPIARSSPTTRSARCSTRARRSSSTPSRQGPHHLSRPAEPRGASPGPGASRPRLGIGHGEGDRAPRAWRRRAVVSPSSTTPAPGSSSRSNPGCARIEASPSSTPTGAERDDRQAQHEPGLHLPDRGPAVSGEPPDALAGRSVSHYRIVSRLGSGGMGDVFLAEDVRLHRRVALKMLRRACTGDEARLLHEARAASALNHPGIAVIYEVGDVDDADGRRTFIAMEHVAGRTLAELLQDGPLPFAQALDVTAQVAEALAEAHASGIVHRDVKPSNVVVTQAGRVKVLDFGLAKFSPRADEGADTWSGPDQALLAEGAVVGTLAYMSPEQARGRDVDARSDVFSLGAVFHELLAGRPAFRRGNAVETLDAVLREDPPPLPPAARAAEPVLRRMLAKDRAERHASMREVLADLEAVRRGSPPATAREPAVAVMAFANISRVAEDDWLGTGIAESVTADLTGTPGLEVVPRERVHEVLRRMGGVEDERLAARLGAEVEARWVVGGGYQRVGDQVRVTARVLEAASGSLVHTVKVDGRIADIFALQDRLVSGLVAGLRLAPRGAGAEAEETRLVEAYEAFSRGVVNLRADTSESLDRAILYLERAISVDSGYARAWAHLGTAYDAKASNLVMPEMHEKAIAAFRKALDLVPDMALAWRELGATLVGAGRLEEGLAAIRRALDLDPTDAACHGALGRAFFIGEGRFLEAAECFERALAMNPQGGWWALQLAHCAALLRDFERSERAARQAIELQEGYLSGRAGMQIVGAYMRLGHLLALQGRPAEALAEYEREVAFLQRVDHSLRDRIQIELSTRRASALLRLGEGEAARHYLNAASAAFERRLGLGADDPFTRYYAACAHALAGDALRALECLEAAALRRPRLTLARARIDPDLDALRGEERFQRLVQA